MFRTTLPLFPTDDGWPYPDGVDFGEAVELDVDTDALSLGGHTFDSLTPTERDVLQRRFGFGCPPTSMRDLASSMHCTRSEAAQVLGQAINKVRLALD